MNEHPKLRKCIRNYKKKKEPQKINVPTVEEVWQKLGKRGRI